MKQTYVDMLSHRLPISRLLCFSQRLRSRRACPSLRCVWQQAEASWTAMTPQHPACRSRRYQRRPPCVHLQAKAKNFDIPLFDRQNEQEFLLEQLTGRPENILLILGPRSSGKTRLLQEVLLRLEAPVSCMSGRSQQFSDAHTMSQVLTAELKVQQDALLQFKQGVSYRAQKAQRFARTLSGSEVTLGGVELQLPPPEVTSISDSIGDYKDVIIEQRAVSGSWPVICIDEANVLMEWVTGGPAMDRDLKALLRFFIQIQVGFFRCEVIGEFPETEARNFLQHVMGKPQNDWESVPPRQGQAVTPQWVMGGPVTDQEWAQIYEVCGGNAGFLISTATKSKRGWDTALSQIWTRPMNSVLKGLAGGPGWTEAQYTLVVDRLAKSPYGAVIAQDLYAALDRNAIAATKVVEALAEANMLAYRPPSEWARDIPMEAFGPHRQDVVTAPSPTHLYCMRRLQRRGALKIAAEAAWISRLRMWAARSAGEKQG